MCAAVRPHLCTTASFIGHISTPPPPLSLSLSPSTSPLPECQPPLCLSDVHSLGPPPGGEITCGSYDWPDMGCMAEARDSAAAYLQAVLFVLNGTNAYALNAVKVGGGAPFASLRCSQQLLGCLPCVCVRVCLSLRNTTKSPPPPFVPLQLLDTYGSQMRATTTRTRSCRRVGREAGPRS